MAEEKRTGKKVYLVQKVDGQWEVVLREGAKVIKKFKTKPEALAFAEQTAKNQDGTVLVRASKGAHKGKFQ